MRQSRKIYLKDLPIGGGAPISIQTMTKVPTYDFQALISEVEALLSAGADVIRVAVKFPGDVESLRRLLKRFPQGRFVADIHFNHKLAVEVIRLGVAGVRLNPGNISDPVKIKEILKAKDDYNPGLVIRIGVNSGSIPQDLRSKPLPEAMVESALRYISILEDLHFFNLKVSLKASDVPATVMANRLFRDRSDYPLHLGVTATGDYLSGIVKSSLGIGALLLEGIGDTIRVSLTAPSIEEVRIGKKILSALNLGGEVNIISCPTCGRCFVDIRPLVEELRRIVDSDPKRFSGIRKLAIMGCEVNGPGEAEDADVGVACGRDWALIFSRGKVLRRVRSDDIINALIEEVDRLSRRGDGASRVG